VRQEIAYRRELLPGDLLSIRTAILEMRPLRIRFYHEMLNDERSEVAAATVITGLLIDTTTRKPVAFPADVVARGRELVIQVATLV
jgi:acyl-CoA thioester hydrolase